MAQLGIYMTYECNQRCTYCFKERGETDRVSVEDFQIFCDWVERTNTKGVSIAGGEPTTHPDFVQLMGMLRQARDPKIQLISNLVCDEEKLKGMHYCGVLTNTSAPRSPKDRDIFERNLERVISAPGTLVQLSHTLYYDGQKDENIFRYCKELNIRHVRLDFSRASMLRDNKHYKLEQLAEVKHTLLDLARRLTAVGVVVGFDCYLPEDTFTKEEFDELQRMKVKKIQLVNASEYACHMPFVNPDLTISSCPFRTIDERRLDVFPDLITLYTTIAVKVKQRLKDEGKDGAFLCMAERFM